MFYHITFMGVNQYLKVIVQFHQQILFHSLLWIWNSVILFVYRIKLLFGDLWWRVTSNGFLQGGGNKSASPLKILWQVCCSWRNCNVCAVWGNAHLVKFVRRAICKNCSNISHRLNKLWNLFAYKKVIILYLRIDQELWHIFEEIWWLLNTNQETIGYQSPYITGKFIRSIHRKFGNHWTQPKNWISNLKQRFGKYQSYTKRTSTVWGFRMLLT